MLGMFLAALDQTIVGPVLPKIVTELEGVDFYTWVVTIYLLTSTVTVPIYGKLSDLYGRKPILMIGIGLFLVGSALSGAEPGDVAARPVPGRPGPRRGGPLPDRPGSHRRPVHAGRARQVPGPLRRSSSGSRFLLGPGLGGILTDNFGWHWIFYVNIPIGIVALAVIWRLLPNIKHAEKAGADRLARA